MKGFKDNLNESSLSRLWRHNKDHECAALTAFRKAAKCGDGDEYSKKDNQKRNKSLLAKLKSAGFGVTVLSGRYPEGGKISKETSYFVVNLNDDPRFNKTIIKFGELFEQDSVLIVPKGAIDGDAKAYLYGTNRCSNNWLGFHRKEPFAKGKMGVSSKIYTSFVNGRPFIFEEVGPEVIDPGNGFGVWSMKLAAEKDWQDLE